VEPVPGTPFGLIVYGSPQVTSGPAVGSLVTGIASLLVAMVVFCFGLVGAPDGWGPVVAGAFGILAGGLGLSGVGLGMAGLRQTRPQVPGGPGAVPGGHHGPAPGVPPGGPQGVPPGVPAGVRPGVPQAGTQRPASGRGLAVAGLICGASGVLITAGALVLSSVIAFS